MEGNTMKEIRTDLTAAQLDDKGELNYAMFLPALSGFYATYVGKQMSNPENIPAERIPACFKNGVESLNYLNEKQGQFQYKWTLYSAGHAELDINKESPKEDMIRKRDKSKTFVLADSGGFQVATHKWEGDWTDPNCPKAAKKRRQVVEWMDAYADYGMMLDIPTFTYRREGSKEKVGIETYRDAVDATHVNAEYYMKHRKGNFKVLNVLQGGTHRESDQWYAEFKKYSDPSEYPETYFEGWAFGGQNMSDIHLALRRLVDLRFDGLLDQGRHDLIHFLGTSKLEWAVMLTDIQRAIRKYHNPSLVITFDCASPFLATANGQVYMNTETPDRKKWVYRMKPSLDDKKYAKSNMLWGDAILKEGVSPVFEHSPISQNLKASDVCWYAPGDLNKIGKEGKTSWDSFSYAIQMGHNVWHHINAVQEANRQYDAGVCPKMLVQENFERIYFRDVINEIFQADTREKANEIIEYHNRFWMSILGTRGLTGKKTVNSLTHFGNLFAIERAEKKMAKEKEKQEKSQQKKKTKKTKTKPVKQKTKTEKNKES